MLPPQPGDLGVESTNTGVVRGQWEVRHTDDVRRWAVVKSVVRSDPHAVCCEDIPVLGGNDIRQDSLPARYARGDERPVSACGRQQIVHRVDNGSGYLSVSEDRDANFTLEVRHDGNDRFFADLTLVRDYSPCHTNVSPLATGNKQRLVTRAVFRADKGGRAMAE